MERAVLFVDDDQRLLYGLTRALRQQPYRIYTARSAEEAMAVLSAHPVDVLVADEKMPGLSGGDLVVWAAKHYPQVIRIVFTGHATRETAIRAINEGEVYRYLTKPCDCVALALAIRMALQNKERPEEVCRPSEGVVLSAPDEIY
jgi:two-component system probable response regulator PhcQ